jgi:RNA polymerase sigma-70 factor, ECF subfamily
MKFHSFDARYLERLRSGDFQTEQHFAEYFSALIRLKLRKRLRSPSAIEDVCQETFTRVWAALRNEQGIRGPERLGSFVNSVCNNVMFEYYRRASKEIPIGDEFMTDVSDLAIGVTDIIARAQMQQKVRQILNKVSAKDRLLLEGVLLNERDKDELCRELGVSREYLRVLLCRAKKSFKVLFLTAIEGSRERDPRNHLIGNDRVGKKPACVQVGERQIGGMTLREVVVKGDREL